MSRRARGQDAPRISLFPFLAVLICTMGALLVLLIVISKKAQARAVAEQVENRQQAAEEIEKKNEESQQEIESINWRIEMLRESRKKTAQRLGTQRRALAHVEEHINRLLEQLGNLKTSIEQLEQVDNGQKSQAIEGELAALRKQVDLAERQLADAEKKSLGKRAAYAVVPYEGRNGTRRWPIYLECKENSIVLQPEGIVFTEQDISDDHGSGNPLEAALRAASEYLTRTGQAGDPYPLLLVRPQGIYAYYAARRGMKSWDADFGYEMIGQDWEIAFQPPNAGLAKVVNDAVNLARNRQRVQRGSGSGIGRSGYGQRGTGRTGSGRGAGDEADSDGQAARLGPGFRPIQEDEDEELDGTGEHGAGRYGAGGQDGGKSNRYADSTHRDPTTRTPNNDGRYPNQTEGQPNQPENNRAQGSAGTNSAGQQGGGSEFSSGKPTSMADSRGKNWALPNASRGSIAFTRGIRVECSAQAVTIVPDNGRGGPRVIHVRGTTHDSVEQLVSAVWEHMRGWGIAGRGMYWKPVLNLHVAPGGEQRARELQQLLDKSGMEVQLR